MYGPKKITKAANIKINSLTLPLLFSHQILSITSKYTGRWSPKDKTLLKTNISFSISPILPPRIELGSLTYKVSALTIELWEYTVAPVHLTDRASIYSKKGRIAGNPTRCAILWPPTHSTEVAGFFYTCKWSSVPGCLIPWSGPYMHVASRALRIFRLTSLPLG